MSAGPDSGFKECLGKLHGIVQTYGGWSGVPSDKLLEADAISRKATILKGTTTEEQDEAWKMRKDVLTALLSQEADPAKKTELEKDLQGLKNRLGSD